jgi:predicted nucleic acid-binding protein
MLNPYCLLTDLTAHHRQRPPSVRSRDPDNDYLLALAINRRAYLVTGDQDLLVLSADLPILTPAQFVIRLRETR